MSMVHYTIRAATSADAAVIAGHRVAMFRDMGEVPSQQLASELLADCTRALRSLIRDGAYWGWLAVDDAAVVIGGAGAHIRAQLPRISHDGTRVDGGSVPLVVNVYTEPARRHQGIARALMRALMAWGAAQDFDRVVLHASESGRPLYQSLGFLPTNEMRWSPVSAAP